MTTLNLPSPPGNLTNDLTTDVNRLGDWLLEVARQCGEPALNSALSAGWPGSPQQRLSVEPHVVAARNEARQLASETWAKERKAAGTWGV